MSNACTLSIQGDKLNEKTGEIESLHQQQIRIFEDYDQLGLYLRQRAKGVPLATNEDDHSYQVWYDYYLYVFILGVLV
jgi:hypothetical protein